MGLSLQQPISKDDLLLALDGIGEIRVSPTNRYGTYSGTDSRSGVYHLNIWNKWSFEGSAVGYRCIYDPSL